MPLIKRKHDTLKAYIHDWLEPDDGSVNFFSLAIIVLVLASLGALALETEAARADTPMPHAIQNIVGWINLIVVWVFAVEFGLRFWSEGENPKHAGVAGRVRFLLQPITMADVLAFLPELFVMLFLPHVAGEGLAALRALRLFRLFKLARYVPAFAIVGAAVTTKRVRATTLGNVTRASYEPSGNVGTSIASESASIARTRAVPNAAPFAVHCAT